MSPILKKFDAVAESRKWKETVSREICAMSDKEQMAFWRAETEKLRAELTAYHTAHAHPAGR